MNGSVMGSLLLLLAGIAVPATGISGETVVVMPVARPRALSSLGTTVETQLVEAIGGLSPALIKVVGPEKIQLNLSKVGKGKICPIRRPRCATQIAGALGARFVVTGQLKRSGKWVHVSLTLTAPEDPKRKLRGRARARAEPLQLGAAVGTAVRELFAPVLGELGPQCRIVDPKIAWTLVEGSCEEGLAHGSGRAVSAEGHLYQGMFKAGRLHGSGTWVGPDGAEYRGQFENGKCQGRGTQTWPNGDRYEGQYRNDKFDGEGTLRWANGTEYVGAFRAGQKNGYGTLTWPNGAQQKGQWENDGFLGKKSPEPAQGSTNSK